MCVHVYTCKHTLLDTHTHPELYRYIYICMYILMRLSVHIFGDEIIRDGWFLSYIYKYTDIYIYINIYMKVLPNQK